MLSKLSKYEIKATARIFLPLYAVLIVYSLICKGIFSLTPHKWTIPGTISMAVYVMILTGILVTTIVIMIQRFYKNLLSDEGYLMFTLPTEPWKHIVSKLVISMMWTAVSGVVSVMSILVIAYNGTYINELHDIINSISKFFESFGVSSILFIAEILLIGIIGLASNVLIIYASVAIGHLANRYRVFWSLGAFIMISAVSQIIFTIAVFIGSKIPFSGPGDVNTFHLIAWFIIIFLGFLSAGYFFLTNYILSKRLNLE